MDSTNCSSQPPPATDSPGAVDPFLVEALQNPRHRLTSSASKLYFSKRESLSLLHHMDPEASRTARESLDLAFGMSTILDTGLDRHTLSVLIALCDLGLNPEALAAVVKELQKEPLSSSGTPSVD